MKTKINIAVVITCFTISSLIIGCAKSEDEKPKVENQTTQQPANLTFTQKIVVEKYTGEWCGNCPTAAEFYNEMKIQYGNKFIGVAIHAGSSDDRYKDNEASKTMYSYLFRHLKSPTGGNVIGFPNVMIMRGANIDNKNIINGFNSSQWKSQATKELSIPSSCGISISSKIVGTTLSTNLSYQLSKELPKGEYAITAYLVENNLDGSLQVNGSPDYKQQHVLRELLTLKEGVTIDVSKLNTPIELSLNDVNIAPYVAANLEVIAFIHKMGTTYDDKKIIQGQIVKAGNTQKFD